MAVVLAGALAGCSTDKAEKPTTNQKVEVSAKQSEEQLLKDLQAKKHDRLFVAVDEAKLTKDQKKYVDIIKNVPGIHQNGDLFVLAVKQDKGVIRYFEEKQDGKKLNIYIQQEKSAKKGDKASNYLVAKVDKATAHEITFTDSKTKKGLVLEEPQKVVKQKATDAKKEAPKVEKKDDKK